MSRPFPEIAVPTLHSVIARHAGDRPTALAIRFGAARWNYATLDRLANRVAQGLIRDGVAPGARILFLGRNSDAVPVLALGANKAGVVPVPVNWRLAPMEVERIAQDCAPPLIFTEPDFLDLAAKIAATIDPAPAIVPARSLMDGSSDWLPEEDALVDYAADAEGIAVQVYTSGSTGRPKGVMLSHRALLGINMLRATLPWDRWGPDDVTLAQAPLGHIGAFGMMMRALFFGGRAVIHETFDAAATLEAIAADRVTKLALVPTAIKMILDLPRARSTDYRSLDTVIYGSAPITPTLLREAMTTFGCRFAQSYGQTETSGPSVVLAPQDHVGRLLSSVGLPMPASEVRIAGEDDAVLPTGETGEIHIRSIANMSGYWNLPEETARALSDDGWVRTGDAGYLDAEGYLHLRGRVKEMIISGAENVYPGEVEAVLAAHPAIGEVAVLGLPDPHWGEAVTAAVVPRGGRSVDVQAVREWARERLAGYKLPKAIHVLDALPLSATGKVDKLNLREALATAEPLIR